MSQTAICLETASVINLKNLLDSHPEDELLAKYSGKRFGCIHCLRALDRIRTGVTRSDSQILSNVDLGSLPQEEYLRSSSIYLKSDERVYSPPCFCHLPGLGDSRSCKSTESRHHDFCVELANGQRNQLFSVDPPRLVRTTMARYIKDPAHREPDISFLIAESEEVALELQKEIDSGHHRTLNFDGYSGWLAVEIQLSKLSVPEYQARTKDHRQRFRNVMWIFHEHFLGNVKAVRAHMDKIGATAYVIKEDGGGKFSVLEMPYKKYTKVRDLTPRPDYCKSALLMLAETQSGSLGEAKALAELWEKIIIGGGSIQPALPGTGGSYLVNARSVI